MPVVFLHGFPQTSYQWRHQLAALSSAGLRLLRPRQPRLRRDRQARPAHLPRPAGPRRRALPRRGRPRVGPSRHPRLGRDHRLQGRGRPPRAGAFDRPARHAVHGVASPRPATATGSRPRGWPRSSSPATTRSGSRRPSPAATAPTCPVRRRRRGGSGPAPRPRPTWIDDDALEHYRRAFSDPAAWAAAIQYYRYALPFHVIDERGPAPPPVRAPGGGDVAAPRRPRRPPPAAASTWTSAPRTGRPASNGPRCGCTATTWRPALRLRVERPSRRRPAAEGAPSVNPFAAQFGRYFTDLRTQAVDAGHFLGEEAAPVVTEALLRFLPEPRR